MSSNSEVGNLKNVTNFGTLISFATGYGATYAPSNIAILLTALNTKKTTAEANLELLKDTEIPLNKQRGIRKALFEPLQPLATRVVSALESSGVSKETIANAKTINRKIQGTRAPGLPKTKIEGKDNTDTISVSQQSYDRQADFFQQLIKLAEAETLYNPSETNLTVSNLSDYQNQLIVANEAVKTAFTTFSNAQIALNQTLYTLDSGLVDLAYTTKKYIKAAFGASSSQYAQVSGIKFTRPKK
jgi:hypothetical protein